MAKKAKPAHLLLFPDEDERLISDLVTIDDPRWHPYLEIFRQQKRGSFGLDIETYGTTDKKNGALSPYTGEIRIITVAIEVMQGHYVCLLADLGGVYDDRETRVKQYETFLDVLLTKCRDPRVETVGQNLVGFEYNWFAVKYNTKLRNIFDTMLASQVYWAGLANALSKGRKDYSPHGLDAIAERLGLGNLEKSEETQKSDWGVDLTIKQLNYAAMDSIIVLRAKDKLKPLLFKEGLLKPAGKPSAIKSEMDAAPAFGEIMLHGVPVSIGKLQEVEDAYISAWHEALKPFTAAFPGINPGSTKQLQTAFNSHFAGTTDDDRLLLFQHLEELEAEEAETEGESVETESDFLLDEELEGTNDKVLAELLQKMEAVGEDVTPIKSLLLWRSLGTQVKYLENVRKNLFWNPKFEYFFVRSKYQPLARTGMGRTSCREPNLQNPSNLKPEWAALGLPPIREIFQAPPGYKMIIADLAQAHAQIAYSDSQDPALAQVYREGRDVHSLTGTQLANLQGLDWDYDYFYKAYKDKKHPDHELAKSIRLLAKPTFYGSLNLQGAETLRATAATGDPPIYMSLEEAELGRSAWQSVYAVLADHQRKLIDIANSYDEVLYDHLGKRLFTRTGVFGVARGICGRRLYLEKYENETKQGKKYLTVKATDSVATRWMATEATAIKLAMGRLLYTLDVNPEWGAMFIRMAHDELNLLVPEEFAEILAYYSLECLNWGMNLFVNYTDETKPHELVKNGLHEK